MVEDVPILFRRYAHNAAQVEPVRMDISHLNRLRDFLNLRDDDDWHLLVAWMVTSFIPDFAHPVLVIFGEQGSCKSTTARLLSMLIDPSLVSLRAEPERLRSGVQAADHSWLITLDNVSKVPVWLSDALCRAVTGEASPPAHGLYQRCARPPEQFQRVMVLTGIETVAQRPDLLDRCILVGLEPVANTSRKSEKLLLAEFEAARPALFGALLSLAAAVAKELPNIVLDRLPRMADFARVGTAVERVCGWPADTFRKAFNNNANDQTEEALSASPLAEAVLYLCRDVPMNPVGLIWSGIPTDLLRVLADYTTSPKPQEWPRRANQLTASSGGSPPNLRSKGIYVLNGRASGGTQRLVQIGKYLETPAPADVTVTQVAEFPLRAKKFIVHIVHTLKKGRFCDGVYDASGTWGGLSLDLSLLLTLPWLLTSSRRDLLLTFAVAVRLCFCRSSLTSSRRDLLLTFTARRSRHTLGPTPYT